jgi:hypothetical protein
MCLFDLTIKQFKIMEQKLITNLDEIEIGDEIIISAYSDLKYLKVLRLPSKKGGTTFKVSLRRDIRTNGTWKWKVRTFEQDVTKHNNIMYQNLYGRDIFLVKRENENN